MDRFRSLVERYGSHRWFLPVLAIAAILAVAVLGVSANALMNNQPQSFSNNLPSTPEPGPVGGGIGPTIDPALIDPVNGKKFSYVYLRLFEAYAKGGEQAAQEEARSLGLLDDEGVHAVLILTKPYDEEIGGRFRQAGIRIDGYYENRVEVTFPADKLAEVQRTGDTSFLKGLVRFEEISDIQPPRVEKRGFVAEPLVTVIPEGQAKFGDRPVEGVKRTGADAWHAANLKGRGVKVGIIDSFANYTDLLGKQLPADTVARDFSGKGIPSSKNNHGTACAQIVHEMAPEAKLYLAYSTGVTQFAQAMDWLMAEQVDVISLSIGWDAFPWDGKSPMSKKVDEANARGIVVVAAAGNEAYRESLVAKSNGKAEVQDLARSGKPTALPLLFGKDGTSATIFLTWQNTAADLAIGLKDQDGKVIASDIRNQASAEPILAVQLPSKKPQKLFIIVEQRSGPATTFRLRVSGTAAFPETYSTASQSIIEPAAAAGAIAVAAVEVASDRITNYSSWGPTLDGRWKPEIGAPSHVSTVHYRDSDQGFDGTSAATPHVAGAAALIKGRFPNYKSPQIRQFLLENAVTLENDTITGLNVSGVGRLALPDPSRLR